MDFPLDCRRGHEKFRRNFCTQVTAENLDYRTPWEINSHGQTVKKLIHCEREGSGVEGTPEFNPQAEFISAEENPVFLRPDKVQGFPQK